MAGSPISPPILAPTPRTARQKRISKLQRHLGEIIPQDLVPLAPIPARLRSVYEWEHPQPLDALQRPEDTFRSPTPAALIAVRLKAFEEERRDSSEAHPDLEEEEELWDPRLVYYADKNGAGSAHR
ncbi:hypothetical protein BT96DRAFT_468707 [Gymnopus androsaceus JB14]|uniref:Uncharacterized protein n=1 Tax=Gymnopus androsaceus JB14 TaxID=1447944 RepID=A0A6A4IMR9_9AGAR|nr:hypothetical protein BT96DRAFT_468707 [Gymnopus androsaceus JB14]